MTAPDIETDADPRAAAISRIKARRDLYRHLVAYVVINAILVAIWATSGAGYFWPAWVLGAWGVGVIFHTWDTFARPISEEQIRREINRDARA